MSRTTIDFGIDLGTTNSAISVMNGGKVETLKVGLSEVLPSCVYIDKKGNVHVGAGGKDRLQHERSANDANIEFKRTMGTDKKYIFETASQEFTSEELSSKVLKELRSTAASRFNTDPPLAVVITIPAMFESPQRTATANAGKLAGFEHVELLQEPVAAAVAAGFQSDSDKAFWIVYDFGGGTFDASIISIRDGQLAVIEHAGDNFLGGANLDWLIVEDLLLPHLAQSGDVSHLTREAMTSDSAIRAQMYKLKFIAEEIKSSLSKEQEVAHFVEEAVLDASGNALDIDLTITREQLDRAINDLVSRSVEITKELISSANLKASDIEKVLMVGGTTFIPLVRDKVAGLGIEVDCSIDPMTIVSRGAAIYAASRRMPDELTRDSKPTTGLCIQLEFVPVVKSETSPVGGRVTSADGSKLSEGMQLTIKRGDDAWESGSLSVDESGVFFTEVTLVPSEASEFKIIARDSSGASLEITPSSFTVTHGLTVGGALLPQTIRLCKADDSTEVLLQAGTQLPASVTTLKVHTVKSLESGSDEDLRIPFAEGDQEIADRNLEGSVVIIKGTDIERSLPAGSVIEISGQVDVSGVFTANCWVEVLDETFEATHSVLEFKPDKFNNQLASIQERIDEIEEKVEVSGNTTAAGKLATITDGGRVDALKKSIDEGGKSDDIARLGTVRNDMVRLQNELDEIECTVTWPSILSKYNKECEETRRLVQQYGDDRDKKMLEQLEEEGKPAVDAEDGRMVKSITSHMSSVGFAALSRQPEFWISILGDLARREHQFSNRSQATSLLAQGHRAVQVKDVETMRSVVQQLWALLPESEAAASKAGGFGSGVM